MANAARIVRPPALDEPWQRLAWVAPLAIAIWVILIGGFSVILKRTSVVPESIKPIEARLIEIPLDIPPLQGTTPAAPAASAAPKAKVRVEPAPKPRPVVRPKTAPAAPILPPSESGTAKSESTLPAQSSGASGEKSAGSGGLESRGGEGGGGLGSDTAGARAIYAPVPEIPDNLRQDAMRTEAIARFKVTYDGATEVTLEKPTPNPRLNQALLATLRQWKFFPAMKNGVAIDSTFAVRIPISVQ